MGQKRTKTERKMENRNCLIINDKIMLFGGSYMIEPATLQKVRNYIAKNLQDFSVAYNDKNFKEKYGAIQGIKHKRVPEEFQSIAIKEPLILNKQFYYTAQLKSDIFLKNELPDKLMEYYLTGKKLNDFLK